MPTLRWSVFDVFANIVPGAGCLAVAGYVGSRLGWLDLNVLTGWDALVQIIVAIVVSYFIGLLLMPAGNQMFAIVNRNQLDWREELRSSFISRNPEQRRRLFLRIDALLLVSAVRIHQPSVGHEIRRLQALGVMLRNASVPLAGGFLVATVELPFSDRRAEVLTAAAVLGLATPGALKASLRRSRMALYQTYEAASWIPEIDESLRQLPLGR